MGGAPKKSEVRPPPGTSPVVSRNVSGEWCAGLSLGPVWSRVVVPEEPGEGSISAPAPHSRSWLMPGLGSATCGSGSYSGGKGGRSTGTGSVDGTVWMCSSCACGCGGGNIGRCTVDRHRFRPVLPSAGAWISCMIPSLTVIRM